MHEVMEKTCELLDCLDRSLLVKELDEYKVKIENNKELKELIAKGNASDDEYVIMDIKKKLYQYDEYKGYMDRYNELMFLVMEINSKYKKIIGKGSCFK